MADGAQRAGNVGRHRFGVCRSRSVAQRAAATRGACRHAQADLGWPLHRLAPLPPSRLLFVLPAAAGTGRCTAICEQGKHGRCGQVVFLRT
jgi:hypothetical protein